MRFEDGGGLVSKQCNNEGIFNEPLFLMIASVAWKPQRASIAFNSLVDFATTIRNMLL